MSLPGPDFWRGRRVVVAGGAGFLGTAVVRDLNALEASVRAIRSEEHDPRDEAPARAAVEGGEAVIRLAATVGGLGFNRRNPGIPAHDNIGSGIETRIAELARLVAAATGYAGEIVWDASRPDGQPARFLDISRARDLLGFTAEVGLEDGRRRTVAHYESHPIRGGGPQAAGHPTGPARAAT